MFRRGEIYLANLNPRKGNEVGKIRPVLIYQSDLLNACKHPTSIVLPLSTSLVDDAFPLRYRITKRGHLEKESDLLCDQLRSLDSRRIISELVATLSLREILEVDRQVKLVLGIEF